MYRNCLCFILLAGLLTGCAGMSAKQQIGVSCESAASALETLTAAKQAGKISREDLGKAIAIYERAVIPVCVPVAESMSAIAKAELAGALTELTARAGRIQ